MLKSQQELKDIVATSGLAVLRRTLANVEKLFEKARVHKMYSQASLYIVGLVHILFLNHQRRLAAVDDSGSSKNNRLKEAGRLQHQLLRNVKATAALYFF